MLTGIYSRENFSSHSREIQEKNTHTTQQTLQNKHSIKYNSGKYFYQQKK